LTRIDVNNDSTLIEQALNRVLRSSEFANATRLKEFLTYIVTETCGGRGDMILGKTIAQDVYGRGADADGKGLSLVKVDAGRLRRRLEEYYAGTGTSDPMHITIHRGGYAPTFERIGQAETTKHPQTEGTSPTGSGGRMIPYAVIALVVLIAAIWWGRDRFGDSEIPKTDPRAIAERQTLLAKSPSTLQAVNLAQQARSLIFPPMDPKRLQATLDMFERAIELDADFFGGYAGAAQVLGMQAILRPPGDAGDALLAAAKRRADRAVALRPDAPWSQSASALVHFAARNFDQANEISKRAVAIDPKDFDTLDFDGLIALFSGNFERALQSADPERHKGRVGKRFMFRNTFAVASFHLGRYGDTLLYLKEAAEQGDPISQISIAYQAAAYYQKGNLNQAEDMVRSFEVTWPKGRIDLLLSRAFSDQKFVDQVIEPFKSAGWSPVQINPAKSE